MVLIDSIATHDVVAELIEQLSFFGSKAETRNRNNIGYLGVNFVYFALAITFADRRAQRLQ